MNKGSDRRMAGNARALILVRSSLPGGVSICSHPLRVTFNSSLSSDEDLLAAVAEVVLRLCDDECDHVGIST